MKPLSLIMLALASVAAGWWGRRELEGDRPPFALRSIISWGGYALRSNSCPAGNAKCGKQSCCPNGTTCNTGDADYPICCPSSADCSSVVSVVYACADTSWTMWHYLGDFCCAADEIGTADYPYVQCLAATLPIPTSIIASSVVQQTGAGGVSTGSPAGTATDGGKASSTGTSSPGAGPNTDSGTSSGLGSAAESAPLDSGLSQGAQIAIAVLATFAGLMAIFIAWILYDRAKTRRALLLQQRQYPAPSMSTTPQTLAHPSPPAYAGLPQHTQELHGQPAPYVLVQQFGGGQEPELDAQSRRE
ncbi:hypothetical protein B0T26DRAFT_869719 [Lasiosphaeria miniovina]|uniref:Uncharacterized protein n=1 Tax=Lasiosphaeria miniovina TaxID=1954250 RepID=A0AA40B6T2_9PEZI|nr:uncharacterized protein B0T26DRAFT_869719 [Lasiosphaeria miniovina]KAK0728730.1 hypothetical protein B0T26DRAFT_869719 [Lasiosphaeria miniovina]